MIRSPIAVVRAWAAARYGTKESRSRRNRATTPATRYGVTATTSPNGGSTIGIAASTVITSAWTGGGTGKLMRRLSAGWCRALTPANGLWSSPAPADKRVWPERDPVRSCDRVTPMGARPCGGPIGDAHEHRDRGRDPFPAGARLCPNRALVGGQAENTVRLRGPGGVPVAGTGSSVGRWPVRPGHDDGPSRGVAAQGGTGGLPAGHGSGLQPAPRQPACVLAPDRRHRPLARERGREAGDRVRAADGRRETLPQAGHPEDVPICPGGRALPAVGRAAADRATRP